MSGTYIQGGYIGTKNITLNNATTDMIEAGNHDSGDSTNVNLVINHSTLNGEDDGTAYGYKPEVGNKDYMGGASIFVDSGENAGNNNIAVQNGSTLNGSVYAVTGTDNNIAVSGNSSVNGSIYAMSASGNNNVTLSDSNLVGETGDATLLGYLESSYSNNGNAKEINALLDGQTVAMGIYGTQSSTIALTNSAVTGDIAAIGDNTNGSSTVSLSVSGNSQVNGDIILADHSAATVSMSDSTLTGNIDATNEGNTAVALNNATVNGNITTGTGNDSITLANNSHVTGTVDGGTGADTLSLDAGSSVDGSIAQFETVNTAGNNSLTVDTIEDNTTWNIQSGSTLFVTKTTGSNVQVNMSSDSLVNLGTVGATANSNLVVSNTSMSTANQQNVAIATYTTSASNPSNAVSVAFSNGAQQVESRNGAYNYNNSLTQQAQPSTLSNGLLQANNDTVYNVMFSSSRGDLASDVQGMIAGLDAAKQAGRMITDDLANRLTQVHLQNLFGHGVDGAQVWGDFLYQNGDYSDDVDYKDITQGVQGGVDWTTHLNNGDSLTGGIALGWTRSRDRSTNGGSNNFNDSVYGNYYSVYGGWQQSLHDNLWGMFVDGSFSYGDMRYSTSANNVSNATTGMTQALDGSSDGNLYTTQARAGVNVVLPGETVIQPYATLGWDKAQEDGFSDQAITFGDSQVSEWNTGIGMRVTTKLADLNKNVELYPWLDARYQTEFSDNTDIKAADYHNTNGHNATMGIFGAGINTTIGKDFSLNTGVYFGTGDVDNDASVQAGVSYHF
ncbi:autotransporter domain-containing protein [Kluyvera georgiana]|uniref:autotransporter domain-containing protein n=1 Tax=Kluyvera georgiana TaxID=73098 RepID=UPI00321FA144